MNTTFNKDIAAFDIPYIEGYEVESIFLNSTSNAFPIILENCTKKTNKYTIYVSSTHLSYGMDFTIGFNYVVKYYLASTANK